MATKNSIGSNKPVEVAFGGTGDATLTAHGVLVGNGTSAVSVTAVGTTGQVLTGVTGSDPVWAAASGNSSIVTTYNVSDSPATWTKNANTKWVRVYAWAGGNGGGSGRKGTTTAAGGGGGGAPGSRFVFEAPATMFDATEPVVIGAGGAGGASQTTNANNGIDGTVGGNSSFSDWVASNTVLNNGSTVTGSGKGGTTTNTTSPTSFAKDIIAFTSQSSLAGLGFATAGASPGNSSTFVVTGGGGGGGADAVTQRAGGTAANVYSLSATPLISGGAGGLESTGINGAAGSNATGSNGNFFGGTGGGGGGGYSVGAGGATTGGTGGAGGIPGGGGGGGGGGIDAVANSGAGGAGGNGRVIVIEFI